MNQQINLDYPVTKQRVTQTAYFEGTLVKYADGMIPQEAQKTLEMIRNRKMKVVRRAVG